MNTLWKKINNYDNYLISSTGLIKKNNIIMKQRKIGRGYLAVDLRKENKPKTSYIHRLVAENFIPNSENKKTVNHIDGNKQNNNVDNLEWATYSENEKHARRIGLKQIKNNKPFIAINKITGFIHFCLSTRIASKQLNIPRSSISLVLNGHNSGTKMNYEFTRLE